MESDMSEELRKAAEIALSCPFCGESDIRFNKHVGAGRGIHINEWVYSMGCYNCGATFPNMYSATLLLEKWNRRTAPPLNRLTDDEKEAIFKKVSRSLGTYLPELSDYANAIQDAMISKNGGK